MAENRILIGKITTAHGIKGLVRVKVFAEDLSYFDQKLFTDKEGGAQIDLKLKSSAGKFWLGTIDGVNDRNKAEEYRGTHLYIARENMPDLDNDTYYHVDLIGLTACNAAGDKMGEVIGVDNFGAGDLLDIRPTSGGESFYVPFREASDISLKTRTLKIPEGFDQ